MHPWKLGNLDACFFIGHRLSGKNSMRTASKAQNHKEYRSPTVDVERTGSFLSEKTKLNQFEGGPVTGKYWGFGHRCKYLLYKYYGCY